MKKLFAALVLAVFSLAALAGSNNNGPVFGGGDAIASQTQGQGQAQGQLQGQGQAQSTTIGIGINNRIDNEVRANATAFAGSASDSTSGASSSSSSGDSLSSSSSGGNTQTINDSGERHYSGSYTVKNVPTAIAPSVYPTAPCMGSTSAGASGVGFGVSFGSSWTDDECGIRETARSFSGLGLQEDAVIVLCTSKYAAAAPACQKK